MRYNNGRKMFSFMPENRTIEVREVKAEIKTETGWETVVIGKMEVITGWNMPEKQEDVDAKN